MLYYTHMTWLWASFSDGNIEQGEGAGQISDKAACFLMLTCSAFSLSFLESSTFFFQIPHE